MQLSLKNRLKIKSRLRKNRKQRAENGYCDEDCLSFRWWVGDIMPSYLKDYKKFCKYADKKLVDEIIALFNESDEGLCSKYNKYNEEYHKAFKDYVIKYGANGGGKKIKDIPEYKEILDKWNHEEAAIDKYRDECFNKALERLKGLI